MAPMMLVYTCHVSNVPRETRLVIFTLAHFIRFAAEYRSGGITINKAAEIASSPPGKLPGKRGDR